MIFDKVLIFILLFSFYPLSAQSIYVDGQLSTDCSGNYSVVNRNCSGSDGDAYKRIKTAANIAMAGTSVLIREGNYTEQLNPQNSGTEENYISYKNYGNEKVELSGSVLSPAIWIVNQDYIKIEGLIIRDVERWLNALGSNHLVIKNNVFERAKGFGSSKTGVFLQSCNFTIFSDNSLHDSTQDNLAFVDCNYSLVERNRITKATHVLWVFKCSNFNVVKNNYFENELQKIGEIYDCENAGYGNEDYPKLNSYDDTKYNVVEGNIFAHTPSSGNASPYAGIQYAGQNGIIRNNVFYECTGPPISLSIYGGEAANNYGNRIYQNVFYKNDFGGIRIANSIVGKAKFYDQKIKNNIFYNNRFVKNDNRWTWYSELDNKPIQIYTSRLDNVLFDNNNIFGANNDEVYLISYGVRNSTSNEPLMPLSWWELNRSDFIKNSLRVEPKFTDPLNREFKLMADSPMIDAGVFLTNTANVGLNSKVMKVADSGWFTDGFGIVAGDVIQLDGQLDRAIILSIDHNTKELILDKALTWHKGQGVGPLYHNKRPDIGAFEFDPAMQGEKF
jgi:hypothetical protein